MNTLQALVCLAYVLSPIDLIPDVLFPIGFADDAVVALIGLRAWYRRSVG
jgi:uncharacterized membrane protein YkvA (DUF1232 family)